METKTTRIPIAMADDHVMMRSAIANFISSSSPFEVIIEAADGSELIEKLEKTAVMPKICILDINMKPMNGYETCVYIKKRWPEIKILALSMYNHEFSIIKMLKSGANGYLIKGADIRELVKALEDIYEKGYYSSELVASSFFQMLHKENENPLHRINERDIKFLEYCCTEMNYKEIGAKMGVSTRTAEGYRNALFEKLNLNTRLGLVMFALNTGIVSLEDVAKDGV